MRIGCAPVTAAVQFLLTCTSEAPIAPINAPPIVILFRVRVPDALCDASFQSLTLIFAATNPIHPPRMPPVAARKAVDPDLVQLKVTSGHVTVDAKRMPQGRAIEIDTPGAAFTIDQPGYYRSDVDDQRTTFLTRRGGRASVVPGKAGVGAANDTLPVQSSTGAPSTWS